MNLNNPMLLVDGYKFSHRKQLPDGITRTQSNWTMRASRIAGQDHGVVFGLQYFLQRYMIDDMKSGFFDRPKDEVVKEYEEFTSGYLGPNNVGSDHIAQLHDLGYMPLEFKALPEGTMCPLRCPCITVENTHPDFFWLPNYIETLMSCILWHPITSATIAYRYRKFLNEAAKKSGGNLDFVKFQGHDFSMRGMSGIESGILSGMGHLLSFVGSDTVPAVRYASYYYAGENGLIGCSVPAGEHYTATANTDFSGDVPNEYAYVRRLLDIYPKGIVSCVADSFNFFKFITELLPQFKSEILTREGTFVVRPDSSDPVKVICGDLDAPIGSPEYKGAIECLWDHFGGTVNKAGFKELDPHISLIYGDAITYDRTVEICTRLMAKGFVSTLPVLGIGSFTYQYNTRDTLGQAMKATWIEINGSGKNLFKRPVGDAMKHSNTGRLAVVSKEGILTCIDKASPEDEARSLLGLVWKDGNFIRKQSFKEIREKLWS